VYNKTLFVCFRGIATFQFGIGQLSSGHAGGVVIRRVNIFNSG
jgi:hypothetical protein